MITNCLIIAATVATGATVECSFEGIVWSPYGTGHPYADLVPGAPMTLRFEVETPPYNVIPDVITGEPWVAQHWIDMQSVEFWIEGYGMVGGVPNSLPEQRTHNIWDTGFETTMAMDDSTALKINIYTSEIWPNLDLEHETGTWHPGVDVDYQSGTFHVAGFGSAILLDGNWTSFSVTVIEEEICADIDGDLEVGFSDLTLLLGVWGLECPGCPVDLDLDGTIGFTDLTILLGAWGACS